MTELLVVKGLKKYFPQTGGLLKRTIGWYKAVDDVSFSIPAGKTYGLVGESGCGKTTVGKSILRLIEPTGGEVYLEGRDVRAMDKNALVRERRNMQIIFQDPYGSLHPRMTIGDIIAEPIRLHKLEEPANVEKKVAEILQTVGLSPREMYKYPHEFSGGQRQRIVIARALAVNPKLIVCDEPVSALDVSVQAQILNLMRQLQREFGLTYLFIAHGMPVVQHMSDRVGVMYLGQIVEEADSEQIFTQCIHPYTRALMSAVPVPDPTTGKQRIILEGEVPSLLSPPVGCLFSTRCRHCQQRCLESRPQLTEVEPGHLVACHLADKLCKDASAD